MSKVSTPKESQLLDFFATRVPAPRGCAGVSA